MFAILQVQHNARQKQRKMAAIKIFKLSMFNMDLQRVIIN